MLTVPAPRAVDVLLPPDAVAVGVGVGFRVLVQRSDERLQMLESVFRDDVHLSRLGSTSSKPSCATSEDGQGDEHRNSAVDGQTPVENTVVGGDGGHLRTPNLIGKSED